MKRIEFIAPVEAMRGNLSGAQKLQYPTDDQGAYEGPMGSVNYARNYSPRFVGAKRTKDGRKYFSVRTKSANHLTAKSKKAMAIMGGAGAMFAAIVRDKSSQLYTSLMAMYLKIQELGDTRTFRKYLTDNLRAGLLAKSAQITITGPLAPIQIDNPWVNEADSGLNVSIAQNILVKFWSELSAAGITFTVDGLTGIAFAGSTFADVAQATRINVLGLHESAVGAVDYITLGSSAYLLDGTTYVKNDDDVAAKSYVTTTEVPA